MKEHLEDLYKNLKENGEITPETEKSIKAEISALPSQDSTHSVWTPPPRVPSIPSPITSLSPIMSLESTPTSNITTIDDLMERDKQRVEDGFPRKINVGRLIKPGQGGQDKVVIVPTTVEDKLMHDNSFSPNDESGGTGEGEEGEVIGEQKVRQQQGGEGAGPGDGDGASHEMESSAYELGKILTEKFELPNLQEKGKKRSLTRYTYDLTDHNRGFGQILEKKATMKRVIGTNIALGNISHSEPIDPTKLLLSPADRIFRILSPEKDFESQAVVFFLRDYSGSMQGKATDLIVSQHVMIYSWLLYQYSRQVETRFILHDTEAKEVPDFYTYYNSQVAGGTQVFSAYNKVNEIVEKENLASDYNIYIFHGTDGDDWDSNGKKSIPALRQMLTYASRIGITVAKHQYAYSSTTEVERYIEKSGLLTEKKDFIRLDVMNEDADEQRIIEGIKHIIGNETTA